MAVRLVVPDRGARAADAQDVRQVGLGLVRQAAFLDDLHRSLDGVLDPLELYAVVLDDGVAGARVAVPGLAQAAGVDDELVPDFEYVRLVRMAHADHVSVHAVEPA